MPFRWATRFRRAIAALLRTMWTQRWDLCGYLLAMAYGLPSAWYPFGSDQGIHWYLGHALLQGQMPYASGISGKPPLIFVVHAIAEILFGNYQSSIRILEIGAMPAFGWLIANSVRRPEYPCRDGEAGMAALLLSAANYTYQDYWNTAHPEFWMTLALFGAVFVAVHGARPRRRALLVGGLSMVAFLLKYPGAAMAIPIAAYCGLRALYTDPAIAATNLAAAETPSATKSRWRRAIIPAQARWLALLREAAWFLAGAAIVFVICLVPFVLTGTVREMYEVCVEMTENYAGGLEVPETWYRPLFAPKYQGSMFMGASLLWGLGFAASGVRKRYRELAFGGFLAVLALSAVGSVVLQKRLFTYHWLASYPFFVALAVWGLVRITREVPLGRVAAPVCVAIAALLAVAAFRHEPRFITRVPHTYREHVERWWPVLRGEAPRDTLTLSYQRMAEADKFGDLVRASDLVRERARPGDAVCLTCFISPVYQLTGMRCSTRHAVGTFVGLGPASWKTEYDDAMRDHSPRFVVSIHTYPRRNRKLRTLGYQEIARFGTVIVFELPSVSASAE